MTIRSRPATDPYREGWERTFGIHYTLRSLPEPVVIVDLDPKPVDLVGPIPEREAEIERKVTATLKRERLFAELAARDIKDRCGVTIDIPPDPKPCP